MPTIQIQLALTVDEGTARGISDAIGRAIRQAIASSHGEENEHGESRPRMSSKTSRAGQSKPGDELQLIGTRDVAKLLGVSECMLWKMRRDKTIVAPVRIGKAVRWNVEHLKRWMDQGCLPPTNEVTQCDAVPRSPVHHRRTSSRDRA